MMLINLISLDQERGSLMENELLNTFDKVAEEYFANANSIHGLGSNSNKLLSACSDLINKTLSLTDKEIIYTSGNIENNNLCIQGYLSIFNSQKHILVENGIDENIVLILKELNIPYNYFDSYDESLLKNNTALICLKSDITKELPKNIKTYCHISNIDIKNINKYDFIGIDGYEEFNISGIGCLIKNKDINLIPLIHGGKSTTKYRSGTPCNELIAVLAKAIKIKYSK